MSLFFKYNVEEVTGIKTALTNEMAKKIDIWADILASRAPWQKDNKPSGIVEATIGAIANPASEEIDVKSSNPALDVAIKKLHESAKENIQNIIAMGGSLLRPVYASGKMQFELIKLGNYIPLSYDLDGTLNSAIITKKIDEEKDEFLLIEKHEFKNNTHTVTSDLYKIISGNTLTKVPLTACTITADITPSYTWGVDKDGNLTNGGKGIEMPFIVEFRNRIPNKIDGSNTPCALWQNTENLIADADKQYNRINWEQEGGEMRVFADEDLFRRRQLTKAEKQAGETAPRITGHLSKLIVKLSGNGTGEEKITPYAPALRTAQQVEAFNQILRRAELAWNIGKGTLSDLEAVSQTATQYTGGKKTLYSFIDTIESELEEKYKHAAYIFAYMISAYTGTAFNDDIQITYNDTGRKDPEAIRLAALQEVTNDIISREEYRQRVFGEDEATAAAKVPAGDVIDNMAGLGNE